MIAKLGQTTDPQALVPGDPAVLIEQAREWDRAASSALEVADALHRIRVPSSWEGEASLAFETRMQRIPRAWDQYSEACAQASAVITDYADFLSSAQSQAAAAIARWEEGEAATASAQAAYQRDMNNYWLRGPAGRGLPILVDAGAEIRAEAEAMLADARAMLQAEGDAAAGRLTRIAESAPYEASAWAAGSAVLAFMCQQAVRRSENAGLDALEGVASFGNALISHPDVLLELLAGIGGIAGGATMLLGAGVGTVGSAGTAIAATGALAAAGAATIGAGATAIGDAIRRAGEYADTDSHVHLREGQRRATDGTFTKGNGGSRNPDWYEKEQKGLDRVAKKKNVQVERQQVAASVEGASSRRYYDGLIKNQDGTYTGIEVKSGGGSLPGASVSSMTW